MSDTSGRLLRLLDLLQSRPDWTGTELAERLEVTTRTIRKDVTRLRDLGYPVDANPGVAGGYRLAAGAHLPPLLLDDDEAVAVAIGLRAAAHAGIVGIEETSLRAVAKLEQMLPNRLRRRVSALQSSVESVRWAAPDALVETETLAVFAQACRDTEQVRFDYADKERKESRRLVEPHKLVTVGQRWYLVAWDVRRDDWRTFRVDRTSKPRLAGVRARRRELPAADAATYVSNSLGASEARIEASVVLHVPVEVARVMVPDRVGTIERVDAQSCRLRVATDSLEWLAMRTVLLDIDFTVESPPELHEIVRRFGDRMAAAVSHRPRSLS
jgi:predicted DNA-binding transcriptional regulator YafY